MYYKNKLQNIHFFIRTIIAEKSEQSENNGKAEILLLFFLNTEQARKAFYRISCFDWEYSLK